MGVNYVMLKQRMVDGWVGKGGGGEAAAQTET